jgi:hypothetical protein
LVVARIRNDGQRTERVLVSHSTRPRHKPAAPVVTLLRLPAPGAGDPWYALQNLKAAVRILATHPDSLRGRLCKALLHLAPVTARDLPESLRPEFESLRRDTTNAAEPQPKRLSGAHPEPPRFTNPDVISYVFTRRKPDHKGDPLITIGGSMRVQGEP